MNQNSDNPIPPNGMRNGTNDPIIMKLKICLLGDGAVGKTSLIRRFVEDVFRD
jgi:GTPase SAR1 family protein